MGLACCKESDRIMETNNQQELKQYIDNDLKIIKQSKLKYSQNSKLKEDLIINCEEISNNLGRIQLKYKQFEECKTLISEFFKHVENEDLENVVKLKTEINKNYFIEKN